MMVVLLAACSSTKDLKEFSKNQLLFGSGGGYTGEINKYILSYGGQIQKFNSLTGETTSLQPIPAKEAKAYFKTFLAHGFDTLEFSSPGNMTYFIGYKNDSTEKKISWGGDQPPKPEIKDFYNSLNQLINK